MRLYTGWWLATLWLDKLTFGDRCCRERWDTFVYQFFHFAKTNDVRKSIIDARFHLHLLNDISFDHWWMRIDDVQSSAGKVPK